MQGDLLNLLHEVRAEHDLTLVVISHNLAVMRQIADPAAVMRQGAVAEAGEAAQVFDAPVSAYARSLIAAWPRLRKAAGLARRGCHCRVRSCSWTCGRRRCM